MSGSVSRKSIVKIKRFDGQTYEISVWWTIHVVLSSSNGFVLTAEIRDVRFNNGVGFGGRVVTHIIKTEHIIEAEELAVDFGLSSGRQDESNTIYLEFYCR